MKQPVLGIDISKLTFDVILMNESKTWYEHFDNNLIGFKRLSRWAKKQVSVFMLAWKLQGNMVIAWRNICFMKDGR